MDLMTLAMHNGSNEGMLECRGVFTVSGDSWFYVRLGIPIDWRPHRRGLTLDIYAWLDIEETPAKRWIELVSEDRSRKPTEQTNRIDPSFLPEGFWRALEKKARLKAEWEAHLDDTPPTTPGRRRR
jgi:hypothetical protein